MKRSFVARRVCHSSTRIESLEGRMLLSATLGTAIPTQQIGLGGSASLNLSQYFSDPQVTGTAVEIQTPEGNIPLALTNSKTPKTVQNFVNYINAGEYSNVIIHRLIQNFVFQGGGFEPDGTATPTFAAIKSEASASNLIGTIAMALSTGANTGTNQWFINVGNNNGTNPNYPNINLDNASDGGPFTVFGSVIYNGMDVVNAISALPTVDDSAQNPNFSDLPVVNYTGANPATTVAPANMLVTNTVVVPALSYSVEVDDPSIVSAAISNGTLVVTPAAGLSSGTTNVTVTATDLGGGTTSSTFAVNLSATTTSAATIGTGSAKSLSYTDADGTVGTIALKGPGTASVIFGGSNIVQTTNKNNTLTISGTNTSISSISTANTTAASTLLITTKGGTKSINVGDLNAGRLKAISAKGVIFTSNLNVSDIVGAYAIGGATGGTFSAPSIVNFTATGSFADDVTISGTGESIGRFSAGSITGGTWLSSGSAKTITAGTVSSWSPDFAGGISTLAVTHGDLNGTITAGSIGALKVKGSLSSATLVLTDAGKNLNTLNVSGQISGSMINATGSLGNISAGALTNSEIYAGVSALPSGQLLPNFGTEFSSAQSIASVKLTTLRTGDAFYNSDIAAETIGTLSLGTILTNNGGITTGIAATKINTLSATFAPHRVTLKNLDNASDLTTLLAKFSADPGDFLVKLF